MEEIRKPEGAAQRRAEVLAYVDRVLRDCVAPDFTGKIVVHIDCRNGGVGGTQAFVQKKI
jgi:hypothetical protein